MRIASFRQVWLVFFLAIFLRSEKKPQIAQEQLYFSFENPPSLRSRTKRFLQAVVSYKNSNITQNGSDDSLPSLMFTPIRWGRNTICVIRLRHLPTFIISKTQFQINVNPVKSQGSVFTLPFVLFDLAWVFVFFQGIQEVCRKHLQTVRPLGFLRQTIIFVRDNHP